MAKKKKPSHPLTHSKKMLEQLLSPSQLGVPNVHRQARSKDGFDIEQLAIGHDREGGVMRGRERGILTHPALLQELYNAMMLKIQESGQPLPERVEIKQTPGDRATSQHRGVLWSYIRTHIEVMKGIVQIADYCGAPKANDLHKVPLTQNQFDRRRFYAWVKDQHTLDATTDFLDQIIDHDNPELSLDPAAVLTKFEIGQELIDTKNRRDAENAVYGALSLAARSLAGAAHDFVVLEQRYRDQLKLASRKKLAYQE